MDHQFVHHVSDSVGRQRRIRDLDVRIVFERLATAGPASRADLARTLGLAPTSVGRLVDGLRAAGLVVEGARVTAGVGRPQTMIQVRADAAMVAGVSVRSRFLRVHLADLDGREVARAHVERDDTSPARLARQLARVVGELVDGLARGAPLAAVVIGISGVWNARDRRVYAAPNLRLLEGTDALGLFLAALGDRVLGNAVAIDNDVNLALIGEHAHGAARGIDDVFYLSLGSGVGGAAMVAGVVQRGALGFAGEIGYLPVQVDGRPATLEGLMGREPLERYAGEAGLSLGGGDVLAMLDGDGFDAEPLTDYVGRVLGQALAAVVTTLDPCMIVLGGGVGRYGSAWTARIRHHLSRIVPRTPEIVSTALGREASLLGAIVDARSMARRVLVSRAVARSYRPEVTR